MGGWGVKKFFFPKSNQIWCVSFLHERHMHWRHFWGPHPLGPWGGAKRSNIIKSELKGQFQRFSNQTLCIFSQMKGIKHIRWDFQSAAWVMARGWDLGVAWGGGAGGQKNFFFRNSTRFRV